MFVTFFNEDKLIVMNSCFINILMVVDQNLIKVYYKKWLNDVYCNSSKKKK